MRRCAITAKISRCFSSYNYVVCRTYNTKQQNTSSHVMVANACVTFPFNCFIVSLIQVYNVQYTYIIYNEIEFIILRFPFFAVMYTYTKHVNGFVFLRLKCVLFCEYIPRILYMHNDVILLYFSVYIIIYLLLLYIIIYKNR